MPTREQLCPLDDDSGAMSWHGDYSRRDSEPASSEEKEDVLRLTSLRELPKSRYATLLAITQIPRGRGRKAIFSHIEVYKMVETIATDLRESGVRPGTVCAMAMPNSIEAVIYFLALQWIGAVAAPVDPDLPSDQLRTGLSEVKAFTLVTPLVDDDDKADDPLWKKFDDVANELGIIHWNLYRSTNKGVQLEQNERRAGESAAWKGGAGDFRLDPTETSVHLVCSPKGGDRSPRIGKRLVVPLSHQNLAVAGRTFAETYKLTPNSNATIMTTPLFSVQGIVCVIATLYSGGHVVIPGDDISGEKFWSLAKENKVNWVSGSSDVIRSIHSEAKKNPSVTKGVSLEFARCHNGVIEPSELGDMESTFGAPVLQSYGPAECSGLVSSTSTEEGGRKALGKPLPGVKVVIVDPKTKEVITDGRTGEIALAGSMVTKGYLDNEEATKKQTIEMEDEDGSKTEYILTGDRGSLDEDGSLMVLENSRALREAEEAEEAKQQQEREEEEQREREENVKKAAEAARLAEEARKLKEEEEERQRKEEEERKAEEERAEKERKEREREAEEAERAAQEKLLKESEKNGKDSASESGSSSEQSRSGGDSDDKSAAKEGVSDRDIGSRDWRKSKSASSSEQDADDARKELKEKQAPEPVVREVVVREIVREVPAQPEIDPETLQMILDRLDAIEANQKAMEQEMAAKHALEMSEMQRLLDETTAANALAMAARSDANPTIQVNMEEINAAVAAASQAAEESSKNTKEAANSAKLAAEAAEKAAAAQIVVKEEKEKEPEMDLNAPKVEVNDPNNVQKTVTVSLDEIEEAMLMHPAVGVCRAFGRPDPRYGNEVYCAIVPKKGARLSEPWLKLHAQSVMPAACVPKKFFYFADLQPDSERKELSLNTDLKRISHLSGYSSTKVVKSPAWIPANDQSSKKAAA